MDNTALAFKTLGWNVPSASALADASFVVFDDRSR
jgi:hypothetical protein